MLFSIEKAQTAPFATDLVIHCLFEGDELSAQYRSNPVVEQLIKEEKLTGKAKQKVCVYFENEHKTLTPVIFLGLGERKDVKWDEAAAKVARLILKRKPESVLCNLVEKAQNQAQAQAVLEKLVYDFYDGNYHFDTYKTEKTPELATKITLTTLDFVTELTQKVAQVEQIANAIKATKQLANQPSNVCNARYLADQGLALAEEFPQLKASFYGETELAELKMNAYLAVGRGSANESIMTVLEYKGAQEANEKPIVLVGKGLTFDSGGISLKPGAGMDEMKYDMCGAATVYGVMKAIASLKLPINVVGVMAGCENMPDSDAYRPGDILTTMSGKTVEITNTDAEGRLVLCDALTFVDRFSPKYVIDIATLTGACIIALGHHYTAVLGNNDALVNELLCAAKTSKDSAWQLPISEDFQKQIKSTCADLLNASGRDGGTITAACFLSQFTQNYQWAHLDIAGTAWTSGAKKGATGRPVSLLVQFLMNQCA